MQKNMFCSNITHIRLSIVGLWMLIYFTKIVHVFWFSHMFEKDYQQHMYLLPAKIYFLCPSVLN